MSDQTTNDVVQPDNVDTPDTAPDSPTPADVTTPTSADSPAAESVKLPGVTVAENALVGDDEQPEPREVEVEVNTDNVPAQVAAPETKPVTEVYVHETSVRMDEPVLDPSSPEAVQIPDAGRGSLDLPIHALSNPTPEEFFKNSAKSDES
jgi:hypothetical protein